MAAEFYGMDTCRYSNNTACQKKSVVEALRLKIICLIVSEFILTP